MFITPPKGYMLQENNNVFILLREDLPAEFVDISLNIIKNSVSEQLTLLNHGRSGVFLFHSKENIQALFKLYTHGGNFSNFFSKFYFMTNRFLHEYYLYIDKLRNNIPVPDYLGGFWIKKYGLYKCGIITKYIPYAITLEEFLNSDSFLLSKKQEILNQCGSVIKKMHDIGILHNDLQLRNILIDTDSNSIFLIDFDKAKFKTNLNNFYRSQNLLRLKRSFIKRDIDLNLFNLLLSGYGISNLSIFARLFAYPHLKWVKLKKYLSLTQTPKSV
ncbi:MAG TPA: lipopolysaccharide kinase InaA family protein [Candidatus Hydrogenedens sp.]|nr:lipopolysaccharide kinase InaA family protein [Candidatus Hydrogenedens sp.]